MPSKILRDLHLAYNTSTMCWLLVNAVTGYEGRQCHHSIYLKVRSLGIGQLWRTKVDIVSTHAPMSPDVSQCPTTYERTFIAIPQHLNQT